MTTPTPEEIAARHVQCIESVCSVDFTVRGHCETCRTVWPCDAARMAEAWREERELRMAYREGVGFAYSFLGDFHQDEGRGCYFFSEPPTTEDEIKCFVCALQIRLHALLAEGEEETPVPSRGAAWANRGRP